LGTCEKVRESVFLVEFPVAVLRRERYAAMARDSLGAQAFGELWARGRAMSLDEAIQYALETSHE
jgi:hypothetical protein